MKNTNKLEKRLGELEETRADENTVRIIIYDPAKGAPTIDNNSDGVIFLLPDNGRD